MNNKEKALMSQIREYQEGEGAWTLFTPSTATEKVRRNDKTGKIEVKIGDLSVISTKSYSPRAVLSAAEKYFEILRKKGA